MSVPITFAGVVYQIPVTGDVGWGPALTRYLVALGTFSATLGAGTLGTNIVPVTNASGQLVSSAVTAATLAFLDATSSIQGQFNAITGSAITALTGDVTATGPGSVPATLATVNATPGTYVSANITVNAKGLITAASSGAGGGTVTSVSGTANQIDSTGGAAPVLSLSSTLVFPGSATGTLTGHSTLDLALTGGTMSGAIAMGTNKITGLAAGTTAGDALSYDQSGASLSGLAVGSQKITSLANGTAATDAAAFGQIKYIQVVQGTTTTPTSTTSTSYVNTNIATTITPSSASNRIKIVAVGCISIPPSATGERVSVTIARGSTNLAGAAGFTSTQNLDAVNTFAAPFSISFIDSPATTGATTYTAQVKTANGTNITILPNNETGVMILEEIV